MLNSLFTFSFISMVDVKIKVLFWKTKQRRRQHALNCTFLGLQNCIRFQWRWLKWPGRKGRRDSASASVSPLWFHPLSVCLFICSLVPALLQEWMTAQQWWKSNSGVIADGEENTGFWLERVPWDPVKCTRLSPESTWLHSTNDHIKRPTESPFTVKRVRKGGPIGSCKLTFTSVRSLVWWPGGGHVHFFFFCEPHEKIQESCNISVFQSETKGCTCWCYPVWRLTRPLLKPIAWH